MKKRKMYIYLYFLLFTGVTLLMNNSCSKDLDTLRDEVINQEEPYEIEEQVAENTTGHKDDASENGQNENTTNTDNEENEDNKDELEESKTCINAGGKANEVGLKTWCWGDVEIPSGAQTGRESFSDSQLALSVECSANQVVQIDDRIKFSLNPISPSPADWCNNNYNLRAEIRTMPWPVANAVGTEEWFGFSYEFDQSYIPDPSGNWLFFQVHEGSIGKNPLISLQVNGVATSKYDTGEIVVVNAADEDGPLTVQGSDVQPKAGDKLEVVIHVVWGDDNEGLLQVWLNGHKIVDDNTRTVFASTMIGGNAKFGIYKHKWRSETGVQNSATHGISNLTTYMGALKIITRKPGDLDYLEDSFNLVSPE